MIKTKEKHKRLVIAGGNGFLGEVLIRYLSGVFSEIIVLSRHSAGIDRRGIRYVRWDGVRVGPWTHVIDGADLLINLAGKSVNCRYTKANKKEILESRIRSTLALGAAVIAAEHPPKCWINASSATIYKDSRERPQTEDEGTVGDDFSMTVCKEWERTFEDIPVPATRKVVMRIGLVLGQGGGALHELRKIVRKGLGGKSGSGQQRMSWIHEEDFADLVTTSFEEGWEGTFNITAPDHPTNEVFMKALRRQEEVSFGLPAPDWLLAFGALVMGTETELLLKSRFVFPQRVLQKGYRFKHPRHEDALKTLVHHESAMA